ncbi:MAG: acyltransferase domain-containing protein [Candidatus Levybacteria bacterium]|nr:acyltransferase domain-containing protein [Candidatus Levybacteria bacterium]
MNEIVSYNPRERYEKEPQSIIACVFPGQGSQKTGMGLELYNNYPKAKEAYDLADDILGFKISDICFYNKDNALNDTQNIWNLPFLLWLKLLKKSL